MPISNHKNFAYSTLATPPSGTGGTSLVVQTGHGTRFPAVPFNATIWPADTQPLPTNAEVVRVTGIASDTFTIVRASESSTARTFAANDQIAATITARTLTDVEYGAHGLFNIKDPAYGAMGDGITDDSAAVLAALTAAAGAPVYVPDGTFIIDNIDVTGLDILLVGSGTLKHKANSTVPMLSSTNSGATTFIARGITFDGNRTNQASARTTALYLSGLARTELSYCTLTATYAVGAHLTGAMGHVVVDHCEFSDMAEHGGTLNQTSFPLYIEGTSATHISVTFNRVLGNTPANADRAAGAFFVSVSGSAPCDFLYNYFERVGQREATNFTGCVDAYTNGGRMTLVGNRAVLCYYNPWKLQLGDEFIIRDNRIEEVVDDDATVGISVLVNVRSPGVVLKYAIVEGNYIDAGSGNNILGIYCAGVDAYHSDGLRVTNNTVSRGGTFIMLERVAFAELVGNIGEGLLGVTGASGAIDIRETDQGAGAPSRARIVVRGGRLSTADNCCLFARTNVTNLDLTIEDVEFVSWEAANPGVTVRDAASLHVLNNRFRLADSQLDAKNIGYLRVHGNVANSSGSVSLSTGLNAVDYGFNPGWDFAGATTHDFGSIASGAQEVTTVTVTGASTSLHEAKAKLSVPLQGIVLSAWVSSANTVSVCAFNPTSGAIDLASATLSAIAFRSVAYDT